MLRREGATVRIPASTESAIREYMPDVSLSYAALSLIHQALGIQQPPTPESRKATGGRSKPKSLPVSAYKIHGVLRGAGIHNHNRNSAIAGYDLTRHLDDFCIVGRASGPTLSRNWQEEVDGVLLKVGAALTKVGIPYQRDGRQIWIWQN